MTGYSRSLPWKRAEANIDMVNSWTKILHNHQIKWGVDVRRIRDDLLEDQTYSPRGLVTFTALQTAAAKCTTSAAGATTCSSTSNGLANDMANFLLDLPSKEGRDLDSDLPALTLKQIFA